MTWDYLLLLVPLPPLGGFVLLALQPYRVGRREVLEIALTTGCAPLVVLLPLVIARFTNLSGDMIAPVFTLHFGEYDIALAMGLDPFSGVVALTVAAITFCVLIFAADRMPGAHTSDLRRFYALMILFEAGMLSMVLAADSIIFFLGWELMGLCSFFLIAYNMTSPRAFAAGQKALLITRIADAALLAGLLLLFLEAGSVRLDVLIPAGAAAEGGRAMVIATLLLIGAMGKSAQFPFHTWLPTAMAGPTPVSALLHSATMVAAGAVLLARFAPVIAASPGVAAATAIVGVTTALFGAACALVQTDVKRLLAYSSISQLGYMFVAVGVGAPALAIAHFVVHAIFKSLLFMAAGNLCNAGGGNTVIENLRGTPRVAPVSFICFTAGAASLAGLPIVTAGWWSKEAILAASFDAGPFGQIIWGVGVVAAALTATYAFRPVFTAVRRRPSGPKPVRRSGLLGVVPLMALGVAALLFGGLVGPIVGLLGGHLAHGSPGVAVIGAAAAGIGFLASMAVTFVPALAARLRRARRLRAGLQMDARYYALLVRPYRKLVRRLTGREGHWADPPGGAANSAPGDPVGTATIAFGLWLVRSVIAPFQPDRIELAWMRGAAGVAQLAGRARRLQTGRVRDYLLAVALGLLILLFLAWGTPWH